MNILRPKTSFFSKVHLAVYQKMKYSIWINVDKKHQLKRLYNIFLFW